LASREWREEIQTSDIYFKKCGSQSIELPLGYKEILKSKRENFSTV
jgi:hypothetical protein